MRVTHVIPSIDPAVGGPPAVATRLAAAQAVLGHDVTLLTYNHPDAEERVAASLSRIPGFGRVAVRRIDGDGAMERLLALNARPVVRAVARTRGVLHFHGVWETLFVAAAGAARRAGAPYVVTPHGMLDPWCLAQRRLKKRLALAVAHRRMLNGAAFIHTLNADERRFIGALRVRAPAEVIPNGVFLEEFESLPAPGAFRAGRADLGQDPYVLFLGRLHFKKGLDYLADAFALVLKDVPEARLVVAGPDDGARAPFLERARALKIDDRVLLPGPLYGRDKLAVMADAAAFCLPSRQEGFSMAITEALACGLPAVISAECHYPEVEASGAGMIAPLDPPTIARHLVSLLRDPALRAQMGGNGRRLVAERFTWPRIAAASVEAYARHAPGAAPASAATRGLAVICGELTPYRVHFHRRIARELPQLQLWTVQTWAPGRSAWQLAGDHQINLVRPAAGVHASSRLPGAAREMLVGREVVRWLDAHRPSAVLVNGYHEWPLLRAMLWARRRGVPLLLFGDSNIRGDHARGLRRWIKGLVVPRVLAACDAVLACGGLGRAFFRRYGVPDRKIFYSPYEPDYGQLERLDAAHIDDTRRRFALDPARRRLVVSSRLVAHKRVDLAIDAFAAIAADRPDWDLVILGDGPLSAELRARVPDHLRGRVIFTGFVGEQATVTAVYRASHVLLHPAEFEPWAVVINEAAAAGLAIVTTDAVGAAAELVREGENGRVVAVGDLPAFTKAALECTDPERLAGMREASRTVLRDWRRRGDPVEGLRSALREAGARL